KSSLPIASVYCHSHRGHPLEQDWRQRPPDKRIAPILTLAEKPVCVQRGLLELFDTQAIDQISVCHYSRAHHPCLRIVCSQRLSSEIVQQDTHAGQKSVHHPPSTSFAIASRAMRLRSAAFV